MANDVFKDVQEGFAAQKNSGETDELLVPWNTN